MLDVSPRWLRQLELDGRIPRAPRDLNGHRRFTPEYLERVRRALFPETARDATSVGGEVEGEWRSGGEQRRT